MPDKWPHFYFHFFSVLYYKGVNGCCWCVQEDVRALNIQILSLSLGIRFGSGVQQSVYIKFHYLVLLLKVNILFGTDRKFIFTCCKGMGYLHECLCPGMHIAHIILYVIVVNALYIRRKTECVVKLVNRQIGSFVILIGYFLATNKIVSKNWADSPKICITDNGFTSWCDLCKIGF